MSGSRLSEPGSTYDYGARRESQPQSSNSWFSSTDDSNGITATSGIPSGRDNTVAQLMRRRMNPVPEQIVGEAHSEFRSLDTTRIPYMTPEQERRENASRVAAYWRSPYVGDSKVSRRMRIPDTGVPRSKPPEECCPCTIQGGKRRRKTRRRKTKMKRRKQGKSRRRMKRSR